MTSAQRTAIQEALPAMRVALVSLSAYLRPGITELSAAKFLRTVLRAQGFPSLAFHIIIAAGSAAWDFHHHPAQRTIRRGEMVVVDFGVRHRGWCMDLTRTVFLGSPTALFRKRYALVRNAQRRSLSRIRAGAVAGDIDEASRSFFHRHRVDGAYRHTTGHGVGKLIHQDPRLAPGSGQILHSGDVVTVEPGLYFSGWGGIRIEDMVEVTATGYRHLTKDFPSDLQSMVITNTV